jgi:protein regulator of cytokinesis 1
LAGLPTWEEAAGRPFLVQGQRVVDVITEALQAKEMAKEAKKAGVSYSFVRCFR